MTEQKFYGTYYHSLTRHSGEKYPVFSGESRNTEKEEAVFQTLKKFTNLTSNHHPENVIYNALIRTQAAEQLKRNDQESEKDENTFAPLYEPIKDTAQKMKFSILTMDFFSKCDQFCNFLRIWSHLLKRSLM